MQNRCFGKSSRVGSVIYPPVSLLMFCHKNWIYLLLQINGFDVHTRQQAVRMFAESQSTITLLLARPAAQVNVMPAMLENWVIYIAPFLTDGSFIKHSHPPVLHLSFAAGLFFMFVRFHQKSWNGISSLIFRKVTSESVNELYPFCSSLCLIIHFVSIFYSIADYNGFLVHTRQQAVGGLVQVNPPYASFLPGRLA